jgi:hypothetical protein
VLSLRLIAPVVSLLANKQCRQMGSKDGQAAPPPAEVADVDEPLLAVLDGSSTDTEPSDDGTLASDAIVTKQHEHTIAIVLGKSRSTRRHSSTMQS